MEDFGEDTGWASTEIPIDFWVAKGGSVGEMYGFVSDGRYEVSDFDGYDAESEKWILKDYTAISQELNIHQPVRKNITL